MGFVFAFEVIEWANLLTERKMDAIFMPDDTRESFNAGIYFL